MDLAYPMPTLIVDTMRTCEEREREVMNGLSAHLARAVRQLVYGRELHCKPKPTEETQQPPNSD